MLAPTAQANTATPETRIALFATQRHSLERERANRAAQSSLSAAQDLIETRLDAALKSRKTLSIPFSGRCLCCEEPVVERRYCDQLCRETYEATLVRKMRS